MNYEMINGIWVELAVGIPFQFTEIVNGVELPFSF